ncbi:MAG: RNA-guided endonuclease TnpB family protein [Nostoc sp.]|uniref:RNA-guided endonuclease TnpB family protein n=1 Tax=Nostoc sp. TaxID=1180 RepID=UPI002FF769FE
MLTNFCFKLRPNVTQSSVMDGWLDMLRSTYNWSLADRIAQYNQQFIQGDYCDIRTRGEACPLTCFVSKNGASGEPWKDTKIDKDGKLKNPRRSAGDIQITALPELKKQGSKNRQKAASKLGRFHKKITDKRVTYQWAVANKIVSRNVDAIALEDLNISGMLKRCRVKTDETTGRFLKNGQSRKKGLNRAISDASWGELILKIEYLAAKQGKVVIKINPKHSSLECRNCGHVDKSNRDGEKFICTECGYHEHADIGAAKTIRDRGLETVRGDSAKLAARQLNAQKVSPRSLEQT